MAKLFKKRKEEMCSNCGRIGFMEDIIVLGMVLRTREYEDVVVRRCKLCGHIVSVCGNI